MPKRWVFLKGGNVCFSCACAKIWSGSFLGVLMCRFLVDHNKRMDKIIEAKMGFAQSIKNPYMDKLETCLDAYCGNQVIECDTNIKACLKVLEKNINEIDFEITG